MIQEEFQKIVLNRFDSIDRRFDIIENKIDILESNQKNIIVEIKELKSILQNYGIKTYKSVI